jgi:rhamnulokinase
MKSAVRFVAVDLGASSGRVMTGEWDGRRFSMEELHRFANGGISVGSSLYWDVLNIWSQMQEGLARYRLHFPGSPESVGVDAWGVDFGLLDKPGRLMGNPLHYRDRRTEGIPPLVLKKVSNDELFAETGVQTMQLNTLFQLYSMVLDDSEIQCAGTLLTIPALFRYFLTGTKSVEFTEATTTQMYSPLGGDWARPMLNKIGIPLHILPDVVQPGTTLSPIWPEILHNCGFEKTLPAIAVASHDTASAVAAIPCMDAHSAFISSGTWSLMGVEVTQPDTSSDALRLHFTNEGGANGEFLLLKLVTGLWIIQECLQHWRTHGQAYQHQEVMEAAALASALRSIFDPNDKRLSVQSNMPAAIEDYCRATGQPAPETAGAFVRSALESLSLKYRSVLESLEFLTGRHLRTLRVVGGGSLNSLLCQMIADACDRVVVSGPAEASALGNVMMQAIAMNHLPDIQAGRGSIAESVHRRTFEPRRSDAWDEAYARFKGLEVD